jgi:hypothetical protein
MSPVFTFGVSYIVNKLLTWATYMSQAAPGYLLIHQVPPIPD